MIDFDHRVDRTYMTNRHQSQFIGQDLLSRFHLKIKRIYESDNKQSDSNIYNDDRYDKCNELDLFRSQRRHVLDDWQAIIH
ncbi:unnamed protein product [Rotaria sp. Silwood1]|nr:unnamed protein product [Rotaria sp. Silwood1]CAF1365020.1 unnamed protein product [Rotaria sp. Silwood1]CAF3562318.1 unnamed protein product [Rotaria sp. Silwood1]CAF3626727.1 unnamed protein product [Rotaria sp. Silwood1]CAF4719038.1 unnamed protein product [Rotaria sp. Silwood1]